MGTQIIRQPDGRLAIMDWDTGWAAWDGTPEEVVEWYAARAAEESRDTIRRRIAAVLAGDPERVYGRQWTLTFAEAQAHSQHVGGEVLDGPLDADLLAELERPLEDADA